MKSTILSAIILTLLALGTTAANRYGWLPQDEIGDGGSITAIAPPSGFERVAVEEGSYADWLRNLPLKESAARVRLYNGWPKPDQSVHYRVVDIDVGSRDLQQCADAIIRLRAEYLFHSGRRDAISFKFTNGDRADYKRWREGWRPNVRGNDVSWEKGAEEDSSYANFRRYLEAVFIYAGTWSLSRDMSKVDADKVEIGDAFIIGGFPGHAIFVVDLARNSETGEKVMLLAQGYTPAQDIHVLKNPADNALSPWYTVDPDRSLDIPGWTFQWSDLRRHP